MSRTLRFRPAEGALLDLESLGALVSAPDDLVGAALAARVPGGHGLVIEGLGVRGEASSAGPPGTVRPDPTVPHVEIGPGMAVVPAPGGGWCVLRIEEPVFVPWPTAAGAGGTGVLVITARAGPPEADGLKRASAWLSPQLGFVRPDKAVPGGMVPLAAAVGNARDWQTDLARLWQPEHAGTRELSRRLNEVAATVWRAEPEGAVWDRQVLGRNWVRYQTVGAAAVEAALTQLDVHPLTTGERVRLLASLVARLQASVQRAATELLQVLGPRESAGPYAAAFPEEG